MYAASYLSRPAGACIGQFGFGTACAVIDANTMVSAKHVDASTVVVEGTTHNVTASYPHPNAMVDLRVIKVSGTLPRYSALPTSDIDVLTTKALGGTGFTATAPPDGSLVNSRSERWGNNKITATYQLDDGFRFAMNFDSSGGEAEEALACLHDSGGYMGETDGSVIWGILTGGAGGSVPINFDMDSTGVLLHEHYAWIKSVAEDSAKPAILVCEVDWNAVPPTAALTLTEGATWAGSARDLTVVKSDGSVYGNIGDPTEEGASTTLTFDLELVDTGGEASTYDITADTITTGSETNIGFAGAGYIELEAAMAGPALSTVAVAFGNTAGSTATIVWDQACTLDANNAGAGDGDGTNNSALYFSVCYPWNSQNLANANSLGTTVGGDTTATHTVTMSSEAAAASTAGTARVTSSGTGLGEKYGSGAGGNCVTVNNFPVSWSATSATSLTAASVAATAWRVRQTTATQNGTATVTKKSASANIVITVWAVVGTTLTEVATDSGTGFSEVSWACTSGVTYLIYSRSLAGSSNIGWDYADAPAASTSTTRSRAGFRSRGRFRR